MNDETRAKLKYRLKFAKRGAAAYIGHLDLQKIFQRAISLAKLPARYSEGFNPHQLISFAQPLSVGMNGAAELADIELTAEIPENEIVDRLNGNFPPGIEILSCENMPLNAKTAAALVSSAVYEICFTTDNDKAFSEHLKRAVDKMTSLAEIVIMKDKKDPREGDSFQDIRGLIFEITTEGENLVTARVACGGKGNLKPQTLAAAICLFAGEEAGTLITLDKYATRYERKLLIL